MFGSTRIRSLWPSILLLGFCGFVIRLFIQGNITYYIHPRYALFSVVMCALAAALLLVGIVQRLRATTQGDAEATGRMVDGLVLVVMILAWQLPAQALSPQAISKKSLNTPSYNLTGTNGRAARGDLCPEDMPASIDGWVYAISRSPVSCFKNRHIELIGSVFDAPENSLPTDMYYFGRVVVSCCAVDARPYALPVKRGHFMAYPNDTWLKIRGTLQTVTINGYEQLVIVPTSVIQTDAPSNPYDYINSTPDPASSDKQ